MDDLLRAAFEQERADQADDARLERVAKGIASRDEIIELEHAASKDVVFAERLEGSRQLDASVASRVSERISTLRSDVLGADGGERRAAFAYFPKTWWRRTAVVVGPLALAAMLVIHLVQQRPSHVVLPEYAISTTSEQVMRGVEARSSRLRVGVDDDAPFQVLLRPKIAVVDEKVVAYAFVQSRLGELTPLDATLDVASEGAVRLTGRVGAISGAHEIRIVVGVASRLRSPEEARDRANSVTDEVFARVIAVPIDRMGDEKHHP